MLAPGHTIDRYVVEAPLGEGGMAQVYRVRHGSLGTLHALKVLTLTRADVRARFLQEGRLQATLRHPNIVAVTDVLEFDGQTALLLEYVDGPTLSDWVQEGPRDLAEIERLFREIVAGVAHAHAQGLVHRDLKPANVLLARCEAGWTAKVADFGLAKVAGDGANSVTRSNIAMGTPSYMAPEQIRNAKRADARSDIYGLGCILYEMLCDRPPYQSDDLVTLLQEVVAGEYPPPETFAADVPARFSAAIRQALSVDPGGRPADCEALLAVLETGEAAAPVGVFAAGAAAPADGSPGPAEEAAGTGEASGPAQVPEPAGDAARPAGEAAATWVEPPPASGRSFVGVPDPVQRRAVAGLTLAAFGLVLVAGSGGALLIGAAWWAFGADAPVEEALASGSEAPAAASEPVPDCVAGEPGRIGWVKVESRGFRYTTTWSSGQPRGVYAELPDEANGWNADVAPVCTLPADSDVRLSEKHELAGAWWVALDGDAFSVRAKKDGGRATTSPRATSPKPAPTKPSEPGTKKPKRQGERAPNPIDEIEEGIERLEDLRDSLPIPDDRRRRLAEEG